MKLLISTLVATALACTAPTDPPLSPVAPANQTTTTATSPRLEPHASPTQGNATDPSHDTATMVDNESAFVGAPRQPPIMVIVPPHTPAPPNCPSCR